MKGQIHLHTDASDGFITPDDVRKSGLDFIAITDHDSMENVEKFKQLERDGIKVIPGIELTVKHLGKGVHMLVYQPEYGPDFIAELKNTRERRKQRAFNIADKLEELGFYCPKEGFSKFHGIITKTHLAEIVYDQECNKSVLEERGIKNKDQFLKTYVEKGCPAYFNFPRPELDYMAQFFDGIKVLAHPGHDLDMVKHDYIIEDLIKKHRIVGIEANSRKHTPEEVKYYNKLAKELGLIVTTSADAHWPKQLIINTVDYSVIEQLVEKYERMPLLRRV